MNVEHAEHSGFGNPINDLADSAQLVGLNAAINRIRVPSHWQPYRLEPETRQFLDVLLRDSRIAPAGFPLSRVLQSVSDVDTGTHQAARGPSVEFRHCLRG